ncbi:MAG: inorganic pyrophosphatase [Acidimicrobiia bacterium]
MAFPAPFYRWRPHPWHGLAVGDDAPTRVNAFIEITPYDVVKYEVDKETGYLKVDRPQAGSSSPPTLYGFIPRTYCGTRVAALCDGADVADGDPLDICIISERPIDRVEILMTVRVVGGLQMIDGGEADDKIIAVLDADPVYADVNDLEDLPSTLVMRLEHYFLSYKAVPGEPGTVSIPMIYGAARAHEVIQASIDDYEETFGER